MKRVVALCFSSLALLPAYSFAGGGTVVCGAVHFVLAGGTQLRSTVISLRNLDLVNPTAVERITIRNAFGDVVHDSGPATGREHPRNTDFSEDFPDGLDITVVPPGANYYLATTHIWGSNNVPPQGGRLSSTGQSLAATVEFSKEGKGALFVVGGSIRARDRFAPGAERSRTASQCTEVHGDEVHGG